MRKSWLLVAALSILGALLAVAPAAGIGPAGDIVVANRASGTISVIDAGTQTLTATVAMPDAGEPMYVTASSSGDRVYVGDRANNRVVVFSSHDWSVIGTAAAGEGVFHMWSNDRQLWVNNDIDNTTTVIDPVSLAVIATVAMPADLVDAGYKPHDVILDPNGRSAFVTLVGGEDHDWVIQFNTRSFAEMNRQPVGLDPHVSVTAANNLLYVPAQNGNVVHVLSRRNLRPVTDVAVPGAHGAAMAPNGSVFYTTNLPGGGVDGLYAIDTATNTVIGSADTAYAVPHNVAVAPNRTLYVTHSGGTSDKVTVYSVSPTHPVPTAIGEVTVGLNPFGLAYVP